MIYTASLDLNALLVTIAIAIILLLTAYTCVRLVLNLRQQPGKRFIGMLIGYGALLMVIIYITSNIGLSMPKSYILDSRNLTIHRPLSDLQIPVNDIENVRLPGTGKEEDLKRISGRNGFFGYNGCYTCSSAGKVNAYATRKNNWIIITTKSNGVIAISPDDMGLYDELVKKIARK